jgi:hypothetical protein
MLEDLEPEPRTMQEPDHSTAADFAPRGGTDQHEHAAARAPVEQRVRHWHHWRTGGILTAIAGVAMLIGGALSHAGLAMEFGGFFMLAGAVIFTVGVIGGWLTREVPLD